MKRSKANLTGLTVLALMAASVFLVAGAQGAPVLLDENHKAEGHTSTATHEFTCLNGDHEPLEEECTGRSEEKETHRLHNESKSSQHVYTAPLGGVTCETVELNVKPDANGTTPTGPTLPSYDNCVGGGGQAHVLEGDCQLKFSVEETVETESAPSGYEETEGKGSATLTCERTAGITVIVTGIFGTCHIQIKPQATITPIYFRNKTDGLTDITVEPHTATAIAKFEGGFFKCGTTNGTHHTTYTGNTTVVALDGEHNEVDSRFEDGKDHADETHALETHADETHVSPTHNFECLETDHETLQACTGHGEEKTTHRKHDEALTANHVFTTALGGISCESVTFDVTQDADGKSPDWPTLPTYSECSGGGGTAHVDTGDCEYRLYVEETVETTSPPAGYEATEGKGSATLSCEEATGIEVTVTGVFGTCIIEVTPQETIKPIYFRNKSETTTDITMEPHTATVAAHFEGGFFKCGVTNGTYHATYTGNTTVIGQVKDGEGHKQVNVRFDDGKTHSPLETKEAT